MVEKMREIGLILINRFVLGWYGVEKRLTEIEAILREIKDRLEHVCDDCPSHPWNGEERRATKSSQQVNLHGPQP